MKFQKMAQTDTFKTADQLGLCIPRYVKITEWCFISSLSPPDIGTWRKTDINVSATVQQAYGMGKTIWGVIRAGQADEVFERVLRRDVRYPFVIDMSTLVLTGINRWDNNL